MERTVVTKGEYARLKGRTPQAVSNWIAEGKISRAAIVGEGMRAQIWVEQADADLARSLDPAQQAAQERPVSNVVPLRGGGAATDDEDLRRRRKADADKAEHDAEAARRKLAVDEGRWVDAAAAAKAWTSELAKLFAETETWLTNTLAREIAEQHGLDWKTVAALIRDLYRDHRTQLADGAETAIAHRTQEAMAGEEVAAE